MDKSDRGPNWDSEPKPDLDFHLHLEALLSTFSYTLHRTWLSIRYHRVHWILPYYFQATPSLLPGSYNNLTGAMTSNNEGSSFPIHPVNDSNAQPSTPTSHSTSTLPFTSPPAVDFTSKTAAVFPPSYASTFLL